MQVQFMRALCVREIHMNSKKIFKLYLERGGKFVQSNIKNLEQININETIIRSENEEYKLKKL